MPRRPRATAAAVKIEETPASNSTELHTLVISNIPPDVYQALVLRTFQATIAKGGRISVSSTIRDILNEWKKNEGNRLFATPSQHG